MPATKTDIKERCDRVNRDGPKNGDENKWNIKPLRRLASAVTAIDQIAANMHVQKQIPVQHDYIPGQHRMREIEFSNSGNQMPEAVWPAQIHRDKGQTHEDRGNRQQFAENNQIVQFLIVVNVNWDNEHRRCSSNADNEGKIRNVDSPRYLIAHAGSDQSMHELFAVGVEAEQDKNKKTASPGVVAPVADKSDADAPRDEREVIFYGLSHRKFEIRNSKFAASSKLKIRIKGAGTSLGHW